MDIGEYVGARHSLLVRAAVLMGRPLARARLLVEEMLAGQARQIRRGEDPDPEVLRALHSVVVADRGAHPTEAVPAERPDQPASLDEEGLAVRHSLGAMSSQQRDAVVLLYFAHLGSDDATDALKVRRRDLPPLATGALAALGADDGNEARHLLALAGDTILVEPPGPLPAVTPARHRWSAAAVLVALLAVATGTSLALRDGPGPSDAAPQKAEAAPTALRGDQLPSLFGYRVADAQERLHGLALIPSVERVDACEPPDIALGTRPGIGATFRMGDTVSVLAARRGARPCPGYAARVAAWDFIGFASGRDEAPAFDQQVTVLADGRKPVVLSHREASTRTTWGSALKPVADAAGRIGVDGSVHYAPTLTALRTIPPAVACGQRRPEALGRRPALELALILTSESGGCPLTVDLYRTAGLIDAVVVRSPRPQGTGSDGSP